MFDNLLESNAKKERRTGGTIASFVIHTVLIAGASYGTMQAKQELEKPKAEKVEFVEVKKADEPPPPEPEKAPPPPPDVVAAPPIAKGFQVLTAPIKIPDVLPDIDLSKSVTNEDDFSGKGVAGGIAKGVVGGIVPDKVDAGQTYFEFQVEKQVAPASGNPTPRYPDMLRSANIEGEVIAQFVVNQDGKADMSTFKILKSSHDQFTDAVRNVLPRMRFLAAEVGGQKVKQLVQMPFVFGLNR